MSVQINSFDPQNPDTWPLILSLKDFRAITGFGHNKTLAMAAAGEIPVKRARGRWMMSKSALLAWLEV